MINIGDRCVIIGPANPFRGSLDLSGRECVIIGFSPELEFDFIAEVEGDRPISIREKLLRKIDDDQDEIPSNIRAIFNDKCDETLPESDLIKVKP